MSTRTVPAAMLTRLNTGEPPRHPSHGNRHQADTTPDGHDAGEYVGRHRATNTPLAMYYAARIELAKKVAA